MMQVVAIKNKLQDYLIQYAKKHNIKYSQAVKVLAKAVNRNHRYIYAIVNGNSQASAELQFAIASFFNQRVDEIFLPVLSGKGERYLTPTGTDSK